MLKKRILCTVAVICVLFVMTGCQPKEVFSTELPTQNVQPQEVIPQEQNLFYGGDSGYDGTVDFDDGSYDPASEDFGETDTVRLGMLATVAPDNGDYPYGGASPVPIDPIDKPTPTPLPSLTFAYQTYTNSKLHITFEAPVGWLEEEPETDTYKLTNPDLSAAYPASITIRVVALNKDYNKNELTKEVKNMLNTIGSSGVKNWEPSQTANRTLMGAAGVYANYKATTKDEEPIAGRVIVTCLKKTLYTVHITYPRGYTDTYVDKVFNKLRDTLKAN